MIINCFHTGHIKGGVGHEGILKGCENDEEKEFHSR